MRQKAYPTSLTQFIQLNSPHHGLLLNTSLHLCVSMLLSYFGTHRQQHFLLRHTFRTRSVLTVPGTPHGGSPSRPGIRVQSPVQAPQLLVHMVFLSFYLRSTLVNNCTQRDVRWWKHIVRTFHRNHFSIWDGVRDAQSKEK